MTTKPRTPDTAGPVPGLAATEHQTPPLLYIRDEVSELLKVPPDTVSNLHRTRQLRGVLIGKHLRWRPNDVRDYVANLGEGE